MPPELQREENEVSTGREPRKPQPLRRLLASSAWTSRRLRKLQDRLLHLLGSPAEKRPTIVAGMLERNANEATSYWLQLVVSIGIATLGLVVGSAAVIIGAMLVAPLMGPIVALAMGLATGSPFLVLRAAGRIMFSVAVAIGGAALITILLPFHELNTELAARTSPTALDLLTAAFCALAGVYASLRPGSDTATTAAGTSIGISLVPPLCASGYGFGTQSWPVAGGAALLFLTNLVAIIVVGTVSFLAAGFNRVNAAALERDELAKSQNAVVTAAISRRLAVLFESKAGPALRFLMPLALLAMVYLPLRRALDEVAWQVRVRAVVRESLAREPNKIVETRVRVERNEVDLLVLLVGKNADSEAARARLEAAINKAAGIIPRVEVLAIPDAAAVAGLESSLRATHSALPLPLPPPPTPGQQIEAARELIRTELARHWPEKAAGEALAIEVGSTEAGPVPVRVVHLGPPLGAAALEGLGKSLTEALNHDVTVVDLALPAAALTPKDGDLRFAAQVAAGLRGSAGLAEVSVCVVKPGPAKKRPRALPSSVELGATLDELFAQHPRVTIELGAAWSVRFVRGACPPPAGPKVSPSQPAPQK